MQTIDREITAHLNAAGIYGQLTSVEEDGRALVRPNPDAPIASTSTEVARVLIEAGYEVSGRGADAGFLVRAPHRCGYCSAAWFGSRFDHDCKTADLPRAIRRDGKYAMRRIEGQGHLLFVDISTDYENGHLGGTSYVVGAIFDPENFDTAVDAAEEEARVLMAEAAREFGF